METEIPNRERKHFIIYGILIILLVGILIYGYDIKNENSRFKQSIDIKTKIVEIFNDFGIKAEEYYALASKNYIIQDYKGVVSNCEKARDYYSDETQAYRNLKAELELEKQTKLIILYMGLLEEQIIITENMYEACEYFESASKYYDIYYNTDVSVDDVSLDMGNSEIEMMNEKIVIHDEAIRRNNDILSKILAERI